MKKGKGKREASYWLGGQWVTNETPLVAVHGAMPPEGKALSGISE